MEQVTTKYGTFRIDKSCYNYQVKISVGRHDESKVKIYEDFFNKLGKFEKILGGEIIKSQIEGKDTNRVLPEITKDDIGEISVYHSQDTLDDTDILIKTREPTEEEKKFNQNIERKQITPEIAKEMVKNIEKYEKYIGYIKIMEELKHK
jgi:hypothetical protein